MLHVVLVEPEIPPNTGNIGRLCVGTGARLHLVGPLGFSTDEKALRRAGLDYWSHLDLQRWDCLGTYLLHARGLGIRRHFLTTKSRNIYTKAEFHDGDHLIFGRESRGLPEQLIQEEYEHTLSLPMKSEIRSYNLATAVAAVLFEAVRQTSHAS